MNNEEKEVVGFEEQGYVESDLKTLVVKTELKSEEDLIREMKLKTTKSIVHPALGKRMLAGFIDFVMALFTFLLLFSLVAQPIKEPHEIKIYESLFMHQLSSGLFIVREAINEKNEINLINISPVAYYGLHEKEVDEETKQWYWNYKDNAANIDEKDKQFYFAYEAINDRVLAFYQNYLTNKTDSTRIPTQFKVGPKGAEKVYESLPLSNDFKIEDHEEFKNFITDTNFNDLTDLDSFFSIKWFNYRFLGLHILDENNEQRTYKDRDENPLYRHQKGEDGKIDYNKIGVAADIKYNEITGDPYMDFETQKKLYEYSTQNVFNVSLDQFTKFDFYKEKIAEADSITALAFIICYVISMFIFYILFPIIFKNGETLSKKMFGLVVVNKDGYEVKRLQNLGRALIFFTEFTAGLFSIGILMIVWILVMAFTKDNRGVHDMIAMTMVIDKERSVWFKNREEEIKYTELVKTEIEKLKTIDLGKDNPNREYIKKD